MQQKIKRGADIFVSLLALLVLSPLLLAVALLIRLKMGSPVLFAPRRPGLGGKIFTLYKFRTMKDLRDENGRPLPDEARLTPLGRAVRTLSLDELPQLWNVLKGDMSLVGPRPLLVQYLDKYTPEQARRHNVRPGITGWAQVNGRNCLVFSRRLAFDVWYVDNFSLWLDLKILLMTLRQIFRGQGVIADQDVREVDDLGIYEEEFSDDSAEDMKGTKP
jgi:sugar transferase EpsL